MIERNKARFAEDPTFDDRPVRPSGNNQQPFAGDDPLAELARIVGQDDPFRGLLAEDRNFRSQGENGTGSRFSPKPLNDDFASGYSHPDDRAPLRGSLPGFGADDRMAPPRADHYDPVEPPPWLTQARGDQQAKSFQAEQDDEPRPGHYDQSYAPEIGAEPRFDPTTGTYAYPGYQDSGADDFQDGDERRTESRGDDYDQSAYADETIPERRSRKGLIAVVLILGMAAVGVASALVFRGGSSVSSDGPPVIAADDQPVKVQPENPGGVVVPDQNKAIYERAGDPVAKETKVVSRQEQPLDVNQALRQEQPSATGATGSTDIPPNALSPSGASDMGMGGPTAPHPATAVLGEPRRVKTVSVRPDGTIMTDPPQAPQQPAPRVAAADPTPVNATPATPQQRSSEPPAQAEAQPAVVPPSPPRPPTRAPLRITPPAQQQRAATPAQPEQVAAVNTQAPSPGGAAPVATSGGSFAVQLGAPGSEKEARDLFASLQRRYGDLGGYRPQIRRAEVNDRTIYRLRVGPFSREDATSLCTRLQASGGQCFVARN
ncbi:MULTISPECIES: SPOR domain-containing protein [unclassified Chelatococcus]|uniref:SPOR domain-containing protein n=1 Tax=unclassified Chelatococcus TaxID=2638111 RepID=UPI001BCC236F|nr:MULTISPECIES: SPOR domain-containing protein [unclassified Chelatococcus]CAH1669961.1 Cell division septation protein DedD [Hyphomicrobiales bacterium]MBS7738275.1 SPOR domain-containing protein [Chelatococcus sp. HY11]MBX3545803.1 SPOR domain-containing protein [Chelatococcus sp.]MCO5077379.1 SPOR domain-containing protein [Chelatococcus sp.]CAH1677808.1 Cell division septation protein DedD [Hyphomicrobiales bacterium]